MVLKLLAALALSAWLVVLFRPSLAWRTRERLDQHSNPDGRSSAANLGNVTVLVPARNEAASIAQVVSGLAAQGSELEVLIIDDQSDDATADIALRSSAGHHGAVRLQVINGGPLPEGWGGKLWALEQGLAEVSTEYCLLLDADIVLEPGVLAALLDKARRENRAMVSVMALLRCQSFWEKLLVPPFIYFFRLLYPFDSVNRSDKPAAAAAGGCILIRTSALRSIGGFASIRDALIDDCTLAARIKGTGASIWLGLSEHVHSLRAYSRLIDFRRMVSRTAFTQLRNSAVLLLLVIVLMLVMFAVPLVGLTGVAGAPAFLMSSGAAATMLVSYWPTVRFYRLAPVWVLTLPLAAGLFLSMTVESAVSYWRGIRAEWKGRQYARKRPGD